MLKIAIAIDVLIGGLFVGAGASKFTPRPPPSSPGRRGGLTPPIWVIGCAEVAGGAFLVGSLAAGELMIFGTVLVAAVLLFAALADAGRSRLAQAAIAAGLGAALGWAFWRRSQFALNGPLTAQLPGLQRLLAPRR